MAAKRIGVSHSLVGYGLANSFPRPYIKNEFECRYADPFDRPPMYCHAHPQKIKAIHPKWETFRMFDSQHDAGRALGIRPTLIRSGFMRANAKRSNIYFNRQTGITLMIM